MKKIFIIILLIYTIPYSSSAKEIIKTTKFTIFSGDRKASFFAAASTICDVFNNHYEQSGYECVAVESKGSESNLYSLADKEADFAIIKTPELNKIFVKNFYDLESKIDFVARIHDEYLTVLVQKNLRIKSLDDLNNRSVNIGSLGSTSALIVQKYFSNFKIKPKEIVNFGAAKSFEMMCDKKIDAWVYFVGHPNAGFKEVLNKCNVEIITIPTQEIHNFLGIAPFLKEVVISKDIYDPLPNNVSTISTQTILASRKGIDPKIVKLIQDILQNHKDELTKKNQLFRVIR